MAAWDNAVRWTSAGLEAVHAAFLNASGWMAGYANLTVANTNTGSGMRRLEGAELFPYGLQDMVTNPMPGDDGTYDQYDWASTSPTRGVAEFAAKDYTFSNDIEGMSDYTEGIYNIYGRGDSIGNPLTTIFLLTRKAHGKDSGNIDQEGFETEIVLRSRVRELGDAERRHQTNGKGRFNVSFLDAKYTPWGKLISTIMSVSTRKSLVIPTRYRMMMHVFVGDGAETDIVVDYTPATETATSTKVWNGLTGAALTVTSVTAATKTIVMSAAIGSGVPAVVLYPVLSF